MVMMTNPDALTAWLDRYWQGMNHPAREPTELPLSGCFCIDCCCVRELRVLFTATRRDRENCPSCHDRDAAVNNRPSRVDDVSTQAIHAMNTGDYVGACHLWARKVDEVYKELMMMMI